MLWPIPGTVVYVWFLGVFRHKGIVSDQWWNAKPMVIANSWASNGVAEVTWEQFSEGRDVFIEGYPSQLAPFVVLYNARTLIGECYDTFLSNCEHFVCKCHGLKPQSPQVAAIATVAALAIVAVAAGARA